jgi:hypothetical protein
MFFYGNGNENHQLNWGGRNEVIETSGRLHPLWSQNKRLHTPRTTDRLHTRQERWIHTELAFTLAKNATKQNTFKIIPLQPTRKENIWETEETIEGATVTLETEQAKWPNPGCLWRWWWKSSTVNRIFFCNHRTVSAVKRVVFASDRMPYIVLRGHWCNIITWNVHAQSEEESDDSKDKFYEELEQVFDHFPKYHVKILLWISMQTCGERIL